MLKYFYFLGFIILTHTTFPQEAFRVHINRINLPIDNQGILANVNINGQEGGYLDDKQFLFSGGFFLSGKNADSIWANAMASASRIEDYQPGNVDSIPYDPKYCIYDVEDFYAFGYEWQKYRYAVNIGAAFYDGDGDGIYNPVDLNGNNQWDPNEDRPDILPGSLTTWCVYNDGVPDSIRAFEEVSPLGIEIHQTLFAYSGENNFDARASTFFVRYKIINTGKVNNLLDSVYFGGWADTDLGAMGYYDDLAGCDTIHNSGYVYNDGEDPDWGINPPAHFIKILQGPFAYVAGETFIDNNSNGTYEEGIDTPLDSAYNFKGEYLGIDTLSGARNLGMTSFVHYMSSHPTQGDPDNSYQARNYLKGLTYNGENYDPCTWWAGEVLGGIDCSQVNPIFMYSGDPVTQYGWINLLPTDQRQLPSSGPFRLEVGKPVNIIVAHIVGRGTDNLNSITVSRNYSEAIQSFYESNFTSIPVSVEEQNPDLDVNKFELYQNYPNPFNSGTTIKFTVPTVLPVNNYHRSSIPVTLKIYDILGTEQLVLFNERSYGGEYEIKVDASALPSGVYFYQLKAAEFAQSKKMILLR